MPEPSGKHAVRELRAAVATPGGVHSRECCAEVRYDLPQAEGESEEAAKQRDDRNRLGLGLTLTLTLTLSFEVVSST